MTEPLSSALVLRFNSRFLNEPGLTGSPSVFTAQCYASAVYAVVMCPSVCPFACLSQAGTVPKRLNARSCKQRRTTAQ